MHFLHRLMAAGLVMLVALASTAADSHAAEWIESFKGKASDYGIKRGDQELLPRPLMRLHAGDRVIVRAAGGRLGVLKADKSIYTVQQANSPYVVPAATQASVWDNLLGIASAWMENNAGESKRVATITRNLAGGFIQIVAAPAEVNLVMADQADLALAWRGGRAPFTVTLFAADGTTQLWQRTGLRDRNIRLPLKGRPAGSYRVEVASRAGGRRRVTVVDIRLVRRQTLPDKAQALLAASLPARIQNHLLVTVLAQAPQWQLQAYDLARRFDLPEARRALERGRPPGRP